MQKITSAPAEWHVSHVLNRGKQVINNNIEVFNECSDAKERETLIQSKYQQNDWDSYHCEVSHSSTLQNKAFLLGFALKQSWPYCIFTAYFDINTALEEDLERDNKFFCNIWWNGEKSQSRGRSYLMDY